MPFLRAVVTLMALFLALPAVALDASAIRIPVSDAAEYRVIPALRRNGSPMRVRDRGPIWVICPAKAPEDINGLHRLRVIWRLMRLTVER